MQQILHNLPVSAALSYHVDIKGHPPVQQLLLYWSVTTLPTLYLPYNFKAIECSLNEGVIYCIYHDNIFPIIAFKQREFTTPHP